MVLSLSCWIQSDSSDSCQIPAFSLLERKHKKVDFNDEEFQHKEINNKNVYMDYGATEDIPEYAYNIRKYGGLTALWTEIGH